MGNLEVLCVGTVKYDSIVVVPNVIGEDDRTIVDEHINGVGGPAGVAAITLARQGVSVGFCGLVGNDATGDLVRERLESEGVDTTYLRTQTGVETPRTVVIVARTTNTRSLYTQRAPRLAAQQIPMDVADWLHLDETAFGPAMEAMKQSEITPRVSLDAGNPVDGLSLVNVDLFVPTVRSIGWDFPAASLEKSLESAAQAGARAIVATDGERGSWVYDQQAMRHVDAVEPPVVLSTLGAGDVFHGALVGAVARGLDLDEAAAHAALVAAISLRAFDASSGIPTAAEIRAFVPAAGANNQAINTSGGSKA